jgi:hypothetical protein
MTKFPHGQLAEEREVLAVQALVALGQGVDAKARAARFQKAYPASMFASTVEAAVQASVPPRSDQ